MITKKLIINALLAAMWAGLALLTTGDITKAVLFAAGAAALRAGIGYGLSSLGKPVPVDS